VRDILRGSLRDPTLTLTTMGDLQDMSGTNDAFNSSICSLEVSLSSSVADPDRSASFWIRIRMKVKRWKSWMVILEGPNLEKKVSGRIRIQIRIKLSGRIRIRIRMKCMIRIRITVKSRIRIRINVMRIRNTAFKDPFSFLL
jgi:hypothetical protein